MERLPFVTELMSCQSATVSQEVSCCKRRYSIALPSGDRVTASGLGHYRFHDGINLPILDVRHNNSGCCDIPSYTVKWGDTPPLKIGKKGWLAASYLVYDEHGDPVLRIKKVAFFTPEYKITNPNRDLELGYIKKHHWDADTDLIFPADLEVKYKAALLAASMYIDYMKRRQNSSNNV